MQILLAAFIGLGVVPTQDPPDLREWIQRLGSDDIGEREEAATFLRNAGRPAWPLLLEATHSDDLEIAARARELLEAIHLRRQISFRLMDACPGIESTLRGGPPAARAAAARALANHLDEGRDFLLYFLSDPDPETALAAAETLSDTRPPYWTTRLLDLLTLSHPPRPRRIMELLGSNRSSLLAEDLAVRFAKASPDAQARLLELSGLTQISFQVEDHILRSLLDHPESRAGVLEWLIAYNRQSLASAVEDKLSPSAPDAADLLHALRRLGISVPTARLLPFLSHENEQVREQALLLLPDDHDPAALAPLKTLLNDPSSNVRHRALVAYAQQTGDAVNETLFAFFLTQEGDPRETAAFLLSRRHNWTAPRAATLLRDENPERRIRGAELIARMSGLDTLSTLVADPSEHVRKWVLTKALAAADQDAMTFVRKFTSDPSPPLRFEACRALARTGKRDDVEALVPWLDSPEFTYRYQAADTYLRQNGAQSGELIDRLLRDPDAALQTLALVALQDRNSPSGAEHALMSLNNPDIGLRRAAGAYLEQTLSTSRDAELVGKITTLIERLEGETLTQVASIVTTHGTAEQAPAVRSLLTSGRAPSENRALDALARWEGLPALLDCLTEERTGAVLERLADAAKMRPLPQHVRDTLETRIPALAASPAIKTRRLVAQYLPDLGLKTPLPTLENLLKDADAGVRYGAVRAARKLNAPILPTLVTLMDDEDPEVRIAATLAVRELHSDGPALVTQMLDREECAWVKRRLEASLRR